MPKHKMRRNDKIITDQAQLEQIIQDAPYVVLGFQTEAEPYLLPIDFAYANGYLYFHCAKEGRKLELLAKNKHVSLLFVNYGGLIHPENPTQACQFSTKYKSVMAQGVCEEIEALDEKERAMRLIIAKLGIKQLPMPEAVLAKTCLYKVKIQALVGKQSPKPNN